jgi:hypothetical protein
MDIYRDYFTRENLVAAVAKAPYVPGRLGEIGLFETRGLTSTTLAAEEMALNDVTPSSAIPRGAPAPAMGLDKRKVHTFAAATYAKQMAVFADEVLNVRAAGTNGAAEVIETRRNEAAAKLRRWADAVHENLRMTTLLSPDNAFGSKPGDGSLALTNNATKTRAEIFTKVIKPLETALAGIGFSGVHVLCSDSFWTDLIENQAIKDTYLGYQAAAELRNDPRDMFTFAGVTWERYRGSASTAITDTKAVAVPLGVPGLFLQGFAPDDTIDSVGAGAMGAPYYPRAEAMKGGKGWEMTMQTHPVMLCTRPAAIITLAKS